MTMFLDRAIGVRRRIVKAAGELVDLPDHRARRVRFVVLLLLQPLVSLFSSVSLFVTICGTVCFC